MSDKEKRPSSAYAVVMNHAELKLEEVCQIADLKLQNLISDERLRDRIKTAALQKNGCYSQNNNGLVPFEIRLGSTSMTLSELNSKKLGDVLPLQNSQKGVVQVWSNGKLCATGTLVVVDGKLAVRVENLVK